MAVKTESRWARWEPTKEEPWDLSRVVHLHRRAGFGATEAEVERDLREGNQTSINRVLEGSSRKSLYPAYESMEPLLAQAIETSNDPNRLRSWWYFRLLYAPDALTEKLTLMWHNHFATSNSKVNDNRLMFLQNQRFRRFARRPFSRLLGGMMEDPALLYWLDAPRNQKSKPNENLARELMELFTLGVGNYTELDVKEAARSLCGRSLSMEGKAFDDPAEQDLKEKIILGRRGRWGVEDLVEILVNHPATSHRLAWRLCRVFMGENSVTAKEISELASGLKKRQLDVGWAVGTILRSRVFFAAKNIGRRVASPVEFMLTTIRALELFRDPPRTVQLANWGKQMGQDLFYPPNVGGWSGGRGWLGTRSLIARANFVVGLVQGKLHKKPTILPMLDRRPTATLRQHLARLSRIVFGSVDADQIKEVDKTARRESGRREQQQLAISLLLATGKAHLV